MSKKGLSTYMSTMPIIFLIWKLSNWLSKSEDVPSLLDFGNPLINHSICIVTDLWWSWQLTHQVVHPLGVTFESVRRFHFDSIQPGHESGIGFNVLELLFTGYFLCWSVCLHNRIECTKPYRFKASPSMTPLKTLLVVFSCPSSLAAKIAKYFIQSSTSLTIITPYHRVYLIWKDQGIKTISGLHWSALCTYGVATSRLNTPFYISVPWSRSLLLCNNLFVCIY